MELANRRVLVTGCAGFIGSHLVDRLLGMGCDVLGVDDLSAGREEFMEGAMANPCFRFERRDLLRDDLSPLLEGREVLCHFAANPDVRKGAEDTRVHLDQNVEVTYRLLEGSRRAKVREIVFPSTSTVYGETAVPTPESRGPLLPISLYGASKLACEALVSGFCHSFDMRAVIYRFANVVGPRSTHNVLHDFLLKLERDPGHLEILGRAPGTSKSYIHVSDCVDAMLAGARAARERVEVYNIGTRDRTDVREIADIVVEEKGLREVEYRWTGGVQDGRGWVGDVRVMQLAIDRLEMAGWCPSMNSSQAIRRAVREIIGKE